MKAKERSANAELLQGYRDGLDLKKPEPSANRPHPYHRGFRDGRSDRIGNEVLKRVDKAPPRS